MVTRLGDIQGVSGQITAHGTITAAMSNVVTAQVQGGVITAAISNVVTAESRGQVTAVGTITAAISTVVTAESRGQVTAVGTVTAQVGTVTAVGPAAEGAAVPANPMFIAGGDSDGLLRRIQIRSAGGGFGNALPMLAFRDTLGLAYSYVNYTAVVLASASDIAGARTAADQINYNHAGVVLHLNVYGTAATAVIGGLIVQEKHNDKYRTITAWVSSITTAGLFTYALHPGAGAGSQRAGVCAQPLPRDWRAIVSGALDANASAAYQLDAHYVGYG